MGILEEIKAALERIEVRLAKCEAPSGSEVDQHTSPLGPRKHCAAVRRLIAEGDPRAYRGRRKRWVMTRDLLLEEMARESIPANGGVPESVEDDVFYRETLAEVGK